MTIEALFEEAKMLLAEAGLPDARVTIPKSPEFGEATSTTPFEIAKRMKEPPFELASKVAARIRPRDLIGRVEASHPGYINFHANWDRFASHILKTVYEQKSKYGFQDFGRGETILIEHTSINPNKALHVGHARNVCLGDLLARLFSKVGYKVVVVNYIDDSGAQMAELLLGFLQLGYSLNPPENIRFDEYCGDFVYVKVNEKIESEPELDGKRKEIARLIEVRGSKEFELARSIANRVLKDQMTTTARLGARYDLLCRESDVIAFNIWTEIFNRLKGVGVAYLADSGSKRGCWCIDLSRHPTLSKEADEVLVKSDGGTTYVARDIAYAAWKLGEASADFKYAFWGRNLDGSEILITDVEGDRRYEIGKPKLVVTVVDSRQRRPQMIVKHALEVMGIESDRYVHFSYEPVMLSKRSAELLGARSERSFVHMSGRRGIYYKADEVLDAIKEIARKETEKRHVSWSREKVDEVSEAIAVASLRYILIKSDTDKPIIFDVEESSRLEGDTGPYLQYSVARAMRILEKASAAGLKRSLTPIHELQREERELLRTIAHVPLIIDEVVKSLLVKKLANHARLLAVKFNDFYERCPVIGTEEGVAEFRLSLVEAFTIVESNLLYVLGIPSLEEM